MRWIPVSSRPCLRLLRVGATALALLAPGISAAQCAGVDLRDSFTARERGWVDAEIAETPYPRGNHWIARKDAREVRLIGTYHFSDPRMDDIIVRLDPLIALSDAVLFESTQTDMKAFEQKIARDPSIVLINDGPSLIDRMPQEDWQQLADKARAAGLAPWMAARMQPWFLGLTLSIPPCLRTSGTDIARGMDKRIAERASHHKVPQVSLEQVQDVLAQLNAEPMEQQIDSLVADLWMVGDEDGNQTIRDIYFDESPAEAMAVAKLRYTQRSNLGPKVALHQWVEMFDALLDTRNQNWMDGILTHPGQRIMVAVGAGHLPGDNGLLHLLEQAGYELERAEF